MRPVPERVYELLNRKSMIGPDKPQHEINIEGYTFSPYLLDPTDWTVYRTFVNTSRGFGNICETMDGRAIAAYVEGNAVKVAFAPNVAGILNGTEVFDYANATTIKSSESTAHFQVSVNLIDGQLHMAISQESPKPIKAEYWRDSNGWGTDFAKVSDITTNNGSTPTGRERYCPITTIHKLGNGNFALCAPTLANDDVRSRVRAHYSTNNGESWTTGAVVPLGLGSHIGYSFSKTLCVIGENEFFGYWLSSSAEKWIAHWTNSGAAYSKLSFDYVAWTGAATIVGEGESRKAYMVFIDQANNYQFRAFELKQEYDVDDVNSYRSIGNFDFLVELSPGIYYYDVGLLLTPRNLIGFTSEDTRIRGAGSIVTRDTAEIKAKSISISRNKGMASNLSVSFDNKGGVASPDKVGALNKILWPNQQINIRQGYGVNLVGTFTGLIDRSSVRSFPQEIGVSARDMLKVALDQTITTVTGNRVVEYNEQNIEDIFVSLCSMAGLTVGEVQETGMSMSHTFSWESYMDAFSLLCDISNFIVTCDEEGNIDFKYNTVRQPTHDQSVVLDDDGAVQPWYDLEQSPAVIDSEIVQDSAETTTYEKGVDYEFEYSPVRVRRIDGGGIGDGDTVFINYIYPAHVFQEGKDLIRVGLDIDDSGLYRQVIVHGQDGDGNIIEATADYVDADEYDLPIDKVLKIDAHDADTQGKCQAIADRAEYNIRSKARTVQFAAVAIPWLQIGDCVQVVESSAGMAEVFVILDMSTNMSDSGYTMDIRGFQMGYAPAPEVVEPGGGP